MVRKLRPFVQSPAGAREFQIALDSASAVSSTNNGHTLMFYVDLPFPVRKGKLFLDTLTWRTDGTGTQMNPCEIRVRNMFHNTSYSSQTNGPSSVLAYATISPGTSATVDRTQDHGFALPNVITGAFPLELDIVELNTDPYNNVILRATFLLTIVEELEEEDM